MIHDITMLNVHPRAVPAAAAAIERWLHDGPAGVKLNACWYSELGPLNRILLWREFADQNVLSAERERVAGSVNPFGAAESLINFASNSFSRFSFVDPPSADVRGPLFEVRDYMMKPDGLLPLMELWRAGLPARVRLAPLVTALYATTGQMPRVLHIYPWSSLEERTRVRGAAQGVGWPNPDARFHIATQETTIYLPTAFSPLH